MVSEEKVRIMTKINHLESQEKRKEIKELRYKKFGYTAIHTLENVLLISVAYILIALIFVYNRANYLISTAFVKNYMRYIRLVIIPYGVISIIVIISSVIYYRHKYDRQLAGLQDYRDALNELEEYYEREKKGI